MPGVWGERVKSVSTHVHLYRSPINYFIISQHNKRRKYTRPALFYTSSKNKGTHTTNVFIIMQSCDSPVTVRTENTEIIQNSTGGFQFRLILNDLTLSFLRVSCCTRTLFLSYSEGALSTPATQRALTTVHSAIAPPPWHHRLPSASLPSASLYR